MSSQDQKKPAGMGLRLLGTLVALGLTLYLLASEWDEILQAVQEMDALHLGGAFLLVMVSRVMTVFRWHMLLKGSNTDISLKETMRITFAGLFAANFLPTTVGGDLVRLAGIIVAGYGAAVGTASLVADRLVGMTGMALMAPFGAARVLAAGTALAPAFGLSASLPARLWEKFKRLMVKFVEILQTWARRPQSLLASLLFTLLHMAAWFAAIWLLLDGLNDRMPYWLIASLWSLVYFITLLPVSINGLGLQELSITYIFAVFGGISEHNGLVMGLVFRLLAALASLPGALFIGKLLPEVKRAESAFGN